MAAKLGLLALTDFAAAFPSLAHAFVRANLDFHLLPEGMRKYFVELYRVNVAFGNTAKGRVRLFLIEAGILQGCPSSGSIFVICMDAFLRYVQCMIAEVSIKAFADDLAIKLMRVSDLKKMAECFATFQRISGLALKPQKCVLIPLGQAPNAEVCGAVGRYIATEVPQWKEFKVQAKGEYLGFQVGPDGGEEASWGKPIRKFKARTNEVASSQCATAAAIELYNIEIAPVMMRGRLGVA